MKVFTIAEGLENLGALRTGGQGSVYKTRRTGAIITAVKMIPTPINAENEADPNYRNFINEVNKLKKVNEEPNPNVVKILGSGITESGSFPFIEMEYIEGPDLAELLKPPHEAVFSIKEIIKVADQLGCALSHCHKADVRHGDIKSNNVKFSTSSGNYVLLDFGLAVMSDEQRRSSLRHAGAIEFMAPEQNEGQMLFQTDVYSFGVILYELVAGQVPFPLSDNGETTRNKVMLQHMETLVPDMVELRRKNMPADWPEDKREREMQVPDWLIELIHKCLSKKPADRYADGIVLHDAIAEQSLSGGTNAELLAENTLLRQKITDIAQRTGEKVEPIPLSTKQNPVLQEALRKRKVRIYRNWVIFLVAVLVLLIAGLSSGAFTSRAKQAKIDELRDSLNVVKAKANKDSIALRKLNRRYLTLLKTQAVINESLRQDSIQRAQQQSLYPDQQEDQQPKRRKKFLGIF